MSNFALRAPAGGWTEVIGQVEIEEIVYPVEWLASASAEQLSDLDIAPIAEADQPADVRIVGSAIADVDGFPTRVWASLPIPLDEAREIAWARTKAIRETRVSGGAQTALGRIDTTPDAQRNLSGAVSDALIARMSGEPWAMPWTMADNSRVVHDADQIIAAGRAVARHVAACHQRAANLRAAIEASDQPLALDIASGWPE